MADDDPAAREFQWLWTVGMVAGVAALALVFLYYWRHSERSILGDFAPRTVGEPAPRPGPPGEDVPADPGGTPAPEAGEQ